jgi:hypothetical protein
MKCYDKEGNEIKGTLLLAPKDYPDHAVFRDENHQLYMVHISNGRATLKNGSVSRNKAFSVAEKCIAGVPIQGSMSDAMNAMAVTMLAAISEYEERLQKLENE